MWGILSWSKQRSPCWLLHCIAGNQMWFLAPVHVVDKSEVGFCGSSTKSGNSVGGSNTPHWCHRRQRGGICFRRCDHGWGKVGRYIFPPNDKLLDWSFRRVLFNWHIKWGDALTICVELHQLCQLPILAMLGFWEFDEHQGSFQWHSSSSGCCTCTCESGRQVHLNISLYLSGWKCAVAVWDTGGQQRQGWRKNILEESGIRQLVFFPVLYSRLFQGSGFIFRFRGCSSADTQRVSRRP